MTIITYEDLIFDLVMDDEESESKVTHEKIASNPQFGSSKDLSVEELHRALIEFLNEVEAYRLAKRENQRIRRIQLKTKDKDLTGMLQVDGFAPPKTLISAAAGLGKTTTAVKLLQKSAFPVTWLMTPNHKLAEEHLEWINQFDGLMGVHVQGRNKNNCKQYDLAQAIGASGISVQESLCCYRDDIEERLVPVCLHFENCPYQQMRDKLHSIDGETSSTKYVLTLPHNYLVCPSPAPTPDLIIVDESPINAILSSEGREVSMNDLYAIANGHCVLDRMRLLGLIEEVKQIFEANPRQLLLSVRNHINGVQLLTEFRDRLHETKLARENLLDQLSRSSGLSCEVLTSLKFETLETSIEMIEAILTELELTREICHSVEIITLDAENTNNGTNQQNRLSSIRLHLPKRLIIPRKIPILFLDASADYDTYNRVFG